MLILQWNITIFCFLVMCVFLFNYYYYYFTAIFITKLQKCVGLQTSKDFKSQNLNPKNKNNFCPKIMQPKYFFQICFPNTPPHEYFNQFIAKISWYYSNYFASDFEIDLSLSVDPSFSSAHPDRHWWAFIIDSLGVLQVTRRVNRFLQNSCI